ncbi:Uncharacterised protein [Streptococcus pneumoniae]|nr:Uncharacterised protein [Streptococcus pneumoniae]
MKNGLESLNLKLKEEFQRQVRVLKIEVIEERIKRLEALL